MEYASKGVLARMQCAIVTDEEPITINCAMFYVGSNPFEVVFLTAEQTEDGQPCEWRYARELIALALKEPGTVYGDGDVRVFSENKFLYTSLNQENRAATLAFSKEDMCSFLAETEKICPLGKESISEEDIDAAIQELLSEE